MDINEKINDELLVLNILLDGVRYYITSGKAIYTMEDKEYIKVHDEVIIKKVIEYITPKSLDIVE